MLINNIINMIKLVHTKTHNKKDVLTSVDFTSSEVKYLKLKNKKLENNRKGYASFLKTLYNKLHKDDDYFKDFKNSDMTLQNGKIQEKGYKGNYNEKHNVSFSGKDSKGTLQEIINVCEYKNWKMCIKIKLKNNDIIKIKNY